MKTIKIILTGLIALVPSVDHNEYVALLVAHDDHTPEIRVKGDKPFLAEGDFDARLVDKPATGGPPVIPKTAMMEWFKTNDGEPLGQVNKMLLYTALSAEDREEVVGRIRLVNITKIEGKRFGSFSSFKPRWSFKIGDQKDVKLVLADRLEIEVEVEDPTLRVRIGEEVAEIEEVTWIRVSNQLSRDVWCRHCAGMRLRHLGQFFRLSAVRGAAELPMPSADRDLCGGCQRGPGLQLLGAKPVRCPGVQFNPSTLPDWDW